MCHLLFIHSSVDGYLGCLHILAIINNAVLITGMNVPLVFWGFGGWYIFRSRIAASYVSSIFSFYEKPLYCFSL